MKRSLPEPELNWRLIQMAAELELERPEKVRYDNLLSTNADISDDFPYETIGGKSASIVRRPSLLTCIPEKGFGPGIQRTRSHTPSSSESETASGRKSIGENIKRWQEDDVLSWLDEAGFAEYEVLIAWSTESLLWIY